MTLEPASLLAAAVVARDGAYAPYSRFRVGAALLARDGEISTGANIENASFGLSMCAERVAIFAAVSHGLRDFLAIAVTGPDGVKTMPCGACRQVLHEFGPGMQVIYQDGGELKQVVLSKLLPDAFVGETVERNRLETESRP